MYLFWVSVDTSHYKILKVFTVDLQWPPAGGVSRYKGRQQQLDRK